MKKILLTGVGGFIGSHCLEYFLSRTDWKIFCLDSFRHKGTYSRINEIGSYDKDRVKIFNHDLTAPIDRQLENQLMERSLGPYADLTLTVGELRSPEVPIDYIFNLASDSAVERSITDPLPCARNNFELALNMLEFARRVKPRAFVQFSTDEVYGQAEPGQAHKEWDVIMPSNVYSASKACQEALAISYWRTYDVPVVICNVMNAIGEWQDVEKFLPKLIWKIATGQEMEIYGEPGKIGSRFYIHCKNIADAMIFLSEHKPGMYHEGAKRPDRYNIVGDMEMDNLEVAQFVAKAMDKELKYKLIPSETARRGYDRRYALDGSKLKEMGWSHPISTLDAIERIVKWTLEHPHWVI